MTVRHIRPLAVAVGLWAGGPTVAAPAAKPAAQPAAAQQANQQLADAVAARLTSTPAAQGADVKIDCLNGVVTLIGVAADAAQKAAVIENVRVVPGVKQVRDGITIAAPTAFAPTGPAARTAAPAASPASGITRVSGTVLPNGVVLAQGEGDAAPMIAGPVMSPVPSGVIPGPVGVGGPVIEPAPLGPVGMPAGGPADAPPLPPYAWPTYAPYNNVSRVAYPQAYPYNAFPYIGPFYPFPKVPLGWRSVKLEWEDGHWWMGRTSAPHDYWRVRFW